MGNNPTKSAEPFDPAKCRCRNTEGFKFKWCECGRSKPSNAKTDENRDPGYETFVRELHLIAEKKYRDMNK